MTNENIPKLGQTVYCIDIYSEDIIKSKVYAIGKDFFLLGECYPINDRSCWFDEYQIDWFYSLSEAKTQLRERLKKSYSNQTIKIVKISEDYWKVRV